MRIGFDLTSGATLQEVELPESTTLLIAPGLMLVPNRGEVRAELVDGVIAGAELTLMLAPEDIERMGRAGVSGVPTTTNLEEHLLVEVKFQLNVDRLGDVAAKFNVVEEPLDLLFVRDDDYPVLLSLPYFDATSIVQDTASVESEVEIES